jgi:hypothetical protein
MTKLLVTANISKAQKIGHKAHGKDQVEIEVPIP